MSRFVIVNLSAHHDARIGTIDPAGFPRHRADLLKRILRLPNGEGFVVAESGAEAPNLLGGEQLREGDKYTPAQRALEFDREVTWFQALDPAYEYLLYPQANARLGEALQRLDEIRIETGREGPAWEAAVRRVEEAEAGVDASRARPDTLEGFLG